MKLVQHHVLVLSCVACGSAVEAGGPLTGPLPSFSYGNMGCWAAYCIPYSNFLGQYHRTYGLSHMDGLVLMCSALLSRSLPVFLYAETFKTGDGQVSLELYTLKKCILKKLAGTRDIPHVSCRSRPDLQLT